MLTSDNREEIVNGVKKTAKENENKKLKREILGFDLVKKAVILFLIRFTCLNNYLILKMAESGLLNLCHFPPNGHLKILVTHSKCLSNGQKKIFN